MSEQLLHAKRYGGILCLLALALVLGLLLGRVAFDDPFVTYRYARNLRAGLGLVYNPQERVLSTTAPLYALLLAGGALLTNNIPTLSNWISVAALFVGACFLYLLCDSFGSSKAGLMAATLYITAPLHWLSLGFETAFYLALILGAFYFYFKDRFVPCSVLLALALLTRGDGILPAIALGMHYVTTRRYIPWRAIALYLLLSAPMLIYLTLFFGSPLPVTLAAKAAQAKLGVTGFYAHTSFIEGVLILAEAYVQQSKLYIVFVFCVCMGFIAAIRQRKWPWPALLWAVLYFAGYHLLGVAPYHWYYAPLIPAFVLLAGWGFTAITARIGQMLRGARLPEAVVMITLGLPLLLPPCISNAQIYRALRNPGSVSPESKTYKVLPEAKVEVYRRVGEWLKEHTPEDAVIGVTEVGVIGYYAERTMVDFLGLIRPDVARALQNGNIQWALWHYQPDYVVLTRVNPLYSYDLRADEWFKVAYTPVQVFEDEHFWGGPVTVYQRQIPRYQLSNTDEIPPDAIPLHIRFGNQVELLAYTVDKEVLHPGDVLNVALYWQCLQPLSEDYTVFVHLLGEYDLIVAQRDMEPCLGTCPTHRWRPGERIADPYMLALPATTFTPDEAQLEVGLYHPVSQQRLTATTAEGKTLGDSARFHTLTIQPAQASPIPNPMQINFGNQIALVGYSIDQRLAKPGETFHLTLYWRALQHMQENYSVFTHLLSENGQRVAQMDSWPQHGNAPTSGWQLDAIVKDDYELDVPGDASPGVYSIHIGIYLAETQQRLWVLDGVGQPQSDFVILSRVRVIK
ncbi:MAG: hypothetical protein H5T68_08505 [Chloroflexi bacterium]|nr:hypothetical protein [Chloroflexota bacterium]